MVRVNMLCLMGALLGLLCFALPILTATMSYTGLGHTETMEYDLYMSSPQFADTQVYPPPIRSVDHALALVLFSVGVALAFVTPLGGASMAAGILDYYWALGSRFDIIRSVFSGPGRSITSIDWGAAFYIGILATILILVSSILPLGPGYSEMYNPWPFSSLRLRESLVVWGRRKRS